MEWLWIVFVALFSMALVARLSNIADALVRIGDLIRDLED